MTELAILYLHGFASSAHGRKARYLREKLSALPGIVFHALDLNPTPTDFEYMTTTGLINRVRQYVLDHELERLCLIGSSYGGLIAVHYAHRFGGVERMLLLAPMLRWLWAERPPEELRQWEQAGAIPILHYGFEQKVPLRFDLHLDGLRYREPVPPAAPVLIVHGRQDEAVPVQDSRDYAALYPSKVRLVEVDATHDLNPHMDWVWAQVQSFLLHA